MLEEVLPWSWRAHTILHWYIRPLFVTSVETTCTSSTTTTRATPLGAKGIGELGAVGVSAAVANAVFHATGTRIRDLPIGIHHLL
jgi:CO/xanthine dehydrogenase Mo-binding subunit